MELSVKLMFINIINFFSYKNCVILSAVFISLPFFKVVESILNRESESASIFLLTLVIDFGIKVIPFGIAIYGVKFSRDQRLSLFFYVFLFATSAILSCIYFIIIFTQTEKLSGLILVTPYMLLVSLPGLLLGVIVVYLQSYRNKISAFINLRRHKE